MAPCARTNALETYAPRMHSQQLSTPSPLCVMTTGSYLSTQGGQLAFLPDRRQRRVGRALVIAITVGSASPGSGGLERDHRIGMARVGPVV